jgi:uncharacterized protein with von Willebrand factor type A (vWA) domain
MGFLDELINKAHAVVNRLRTTPDVKGTHHDTVEHDTFDGWTWDDLKADVPPIGRDIEELGTVHDYVEDAYQDIYNMLHQGDPHLRDKDTIEELHRTNRDMMESFLDMPEIKKLRMSTMHDQYATAMGMLSMKSEIRQAYETMAEARQAAKDAAEAQQALQDMLNQLGAMAAQAAGMGEGDEGADELGEAMSALMAQIQEQAGLTDEALAAAQQAAQQGAREAAQQVKQAAGQAADDLHNEQEAAKAFGKDQAELQRMSFKEREALSQRLSQIRDLRGFAEMIGQGINMEIGTTREKVTNSPDEIVGVRLSNDLTHLTGGEHMALADPILETDFLRRYVEHALVTYELAGREKMARGPIIVICDESGSMHGQPEQWAAATSMSLAKRCQRDHRDFTYIGFSSVYDQYRLDFPDGQASMDEIIDMVTHFFGGGTYYETPLQMAADIVMEYHEAGKSKPDIVFITDDAYTNLDDGFMEKWNKVKQITGMRCFGILLGAHDHQSGAVESVADNTRIIPDMDNLDNVRDIFRVL